MTPGYRMLRMHHDLLPLSFDYLKELASDGSISFTEDIDQACIFRSWQDFVSAACYVWLASGPVDLTFQDVYLMPVGGSSGA